MEEQEKNINSIIDNTLINLDREYYKKEIRRIKYLQENNEIDEEFDWFLDIINLKIPSAELLNSYYLKMGEMISYFIYGLWNEYYEDLDVIKNQIFIETEYSTKCIDERIKLLKDKNVDELIKYKNELESIKSILDGWIQDITTNILKKK